MDLKAVETNTQSMELEQIVRLANCRYGRHFLLRSYSIELLLYLLKHSKAEGIEDLLLDLKSSTPKLPAFLSYLSLLEAKGCITKLQSRAKRSQRTIMLTNECETAIRKCLQTPATDQPDAQN